MKRCITFSFSFYLLLAQLAAQITINRADISPFGVTAIQTRDTMLDATITPGGTGEQAWDFLALKSQDPHQFEFAVASETPYGDNFPAANMAAIRDGSFYLYGNIQDNGIKTVGTYGPIQFGTLNFIADIKFDPGQSIIRFPANLNDAFNESVKIYIQIPGSIIPAPFDSIRQITTTERSVVFDAFGEVKTPLGTFEAIRSTEIETSVDSIFYLDGTWQFASETSPKTVTYYNWWTNKNDFAFPLVQIEHSDSDTLANWLSDFTSDAGEEYADLRFSLFPNPASDFLKIETPDDFKGAVILMDFNGRPVTTRNITGGGVTLDVKGLPTGAYMAYLKNEKGRFAGYKKFEITK